MQKTDRISSTLRKRIHTPPTEVDLRRDRKRQKEFQQTALDHFNAAFRLTNTHDFSNAIQKAIQAERKALSNLRGRTKDRAQFFRCRAMISFMQYWLESDAQPKKLLLDKAWHDAKRALSSFDAAGNALEKVKTFNQFSFSAALGINYDGNFRSRVARSKEVVAIARQIVALVSRLKDKEVAATALARTALFLDTCGDEVSDPRTRYRVDLEGVRLWNRALRTSREAALAGISNPPLGFFRILAEDEGLSICQEALNLARRRKDCFSIGWLTDQMSARTYWKARRGENLKVCREAAMESLSFAKEAVANYETLNFTSPNDGVAWVHSPYAEYFWLLAELQSSSTERQLLLEKSMRSTPELLQLARRTGYSEIVFYAHHITAKVATTLAETAANPRRKHKLLFQALGHRRQAIKAGKAHIPPGHWNLGLNLRYLADIQSNLANLELNSQKRRMLLMGAVKNKERGLAISSQYLRSLAKAQSHLLRVPLGAYYRGHGDLLLKLADLAKSQSWVRRAALAYSSAAEWLENTSMYAGLSECYWKTGQLYSRLQAHSIASENYALASNAYERAANGIPHLKELYHDYALYMKAWSRIEKAREHHERLELYQAGNRYREAANFLRSSKRWNPLALHYSAMAKMESGESHSRQGNSSEAILCFKQASETFHQSRASSHQLLIALDQASEREMIESQAEPLREEYCLARVVLEEARIAESRGDHLTGSEKYALAADKFKEVSRSSRAEERKEGEFLCLLAKAWERSARAALNDSVELLKGARALFQRARRCAPDRNAGLLALGHIDLCDALIASAEFANTIDVFPYENALRKIDAATSCYLRAGYKAAADYASARKLLLQASFQISQGNKRNSQKETKILYESAAVLLHESANAFDRAGHHAEKSDVLGLIDKVKMEWGLASQLTDILNAAARKTTSLAFVIPTHGRETPAGVERFEQPGIEATLVDSSSSESADRLSFEVRVTNIGNQAIRLRRIDDIIPNETELVDVSANWRTKGQGLETVERRIAPLKTETVTLTLRLASKDGLLRCRPRIDFIDEKGVQRQHVLRQRVFLTSPILAFLVSAFVQDYREQQYGLDQSGWRTLIEVVSVIKAPRSHVYGDPRYGHVFGRQLEVLVKSSLVETRIFHGERGRGGDIAKVRARYDNDDLRDYIDELSRHSDGVRSSVSSSV